MALQRTATASAVVPTYCKSAQVDGLKMAYREAGVPDSPKTGPVAWVSRILPSVPRPDPGSGHSLPRDCARLPGIRHSDMPDPATFAYTFDKLSEITEAFLNERGFDHYGLFVQDYGGPVGFRIVMRHPEALDWLIIQNTNA
jgi:pimeloyl-ACP methyl ester carboxylesterase